MTDDDFKDLPFKPPPVAAGAYVNPSDRVDFPAPHRESRDLFSALAHIYAQMACTDDPISSVEFARKDIEELVAAWKKNIDAFRRLPEREQNKIVKAELERRIKILKSFAIAPEFLEAAQKQLDTLI